MRATHLVSSLLTLTLLCAGIARAQKSCPTPPPRLFETAPAATLPADAPAAGRDEPGTKMLILSDNQEHLLTGVQLRSMGVLSDEFIASVAMRSPLAHVGGRLLFAEALRFGRREGAGLVLHLGDAADISCPDELSSVFDVLDREAPRDKNGHPVWFMAPGNHDGILLGTYVQYQPSFEDSKKPRPEDFDGVYNKRPREGLGHNDRTWLNACMSPTLEEHKHHAGMRVKGLLTKGDAIELYLKRLASREGFEGFERNDLKQIDKDEVEIANLKFRCKLESVSIKSQGYTAIARICPPIEVEAKDKDKKSTWVGPYASYIVQKLEVGGNTIVLLDTADYINPTTCYIGFTAHLTDAQQRHADGLFGNGSPGWPGREKVIVAGHHPLDVFDSKHRRWVMERSSRYISGHTHKPTRLIKHSTAKGSLRTEELNVGSTLDYPPQAVVAKLTPAALSYRVAGADVKKTKWAGFLDVCECRRDEWRLRDTKHYKDYRSGRYVNRLLDSLTAAAKIAPSGRNLGIPSGNDLGDWKRLHDALGDINKSEGEAAQFWACQAFYASEATPEESWLERLNVRRPPCHLLNLLPF